MTMEIRPAITDADLVTLVAITGSVTPDDPTSVEEIRWADETYPGGVRFLASLDGTDVGAVTAGRIYVYPPEHPNLWLTLTVEASARRRGVGTALLAAVSAHAAAIGKTGFEVRVTADRPEALAFLERRGYVEEERSKSVALPLVGRAVPDVTMPAGVVLTDLAARPDLIDGVRETALEAFPDIPGGDTPMLVGDLPEFRARDVDRPGLAHEAFMLALDEASGEVVGYASLLFAPGSSTVAWHDMTAVRRARRGRGIATALKLATIRWAIEHGLTTLETGNDESNIGMRTVNLRLGYQPLPDEIFMKGPLVPGDGAVGRDAAS
jgi:GNAT superfamily N-acetyltransferase